jgi:hypothetical protein
MAVKIAETLRRRRSVALLTAAVAGSAIAVAGCGGGSDNGSSAGEVASYVPSTSPLYLEVTTDFDGAQWTQVEELAMRFPGFPEFQRMLQDELRSGKVDFETEVRPLLGERAAVAGLQPPDAAGLQGSLTAPDAGDAADVADDLGFVGVVELADGASQQAKDLLVREGAVSRGERGGAELFAETGEDTVVAVTGDALVLSDAEEQLFAALDAHAGGGGQTLAGTDKFTDALAKLPAEVFGQAYLDIGAFIGAAAEGAGPQAEQLNLDDYRDAVMAASISAEPEGARMKGVILGAPADVQPAEFTPALTETVPADALVYLGFSNLSGTIGQVLEQVQGSLSDEERRQLEGFSAQLPQLLGVSLEELSALAEQEHALVVTPGATPRATPGAALALEVEDGAQAQATLDKLRTGIPALVRTFSPDTRIPQWTRVPLAGGAEGWRLPLSPEAGVVYGVDGDLAVIGTSVRAVTSVQRPVAPLSGSAAYQAGTAGMPEQVTSVLWVNLQDGLAALDNAGAFDDDDAKTLANLRPLKSIAAWTTAGEMPTFEVFLRISG